MKVKHIFILSFFSVFVIIINGCRTINDSRTQNDRYPRQSEREIFLLKDIEASKTIVHLIKLGNISIYANHDLLQGTYLKILESKSWNDEYKQKVKSEYFLFTSVSDSAKANNSELSLVETDTLFPILKSQLGELISDLLSRGKCVITIDSVTIEKIIRRTIEFSDYSWETQYLYDSKVFWSYTMEI